jgi:hypothetical protein
MCCLLVLTSIYDYVLLLCFVVLCCPITAGALQRVHRLGHGMAQQLGLPIMTSDDADSYVTNAVHLGTEVSQCRKRIQEVQQVYSTCNPIDEPHILSSCRVRDALCQRKLKLYSTGDLDFGGGEAGRNEVTEEWELFLRRIVRSIS